MTQTFFDQTLVKLLWVLFSSRLQPWSCWACPCWAYIAQSKQESLELVAGLQSEGSLMGKAGHGNPLGLQPVAQSVGGPGTLKLAADKVRAVLLQTLTLNLWSLTLTRGVSIRIGFQYTATCKTNLLPLGSCPFICRASWVHRQPITLERAESDTQVAEVLILTYCVFLKDYYLNLFFWHILGDRQN